MPHSTRRSRFKTSCSRRESGALRWRRRARYGEAGPRRRLSNISGSDSIGKEAWLPMQTAVQNAMVRGPMQVFIPGSSVSPSSTV